jgi:hypothetical protein
MSIPLPNLDDRRWADLVEEGRALIPVYAPEWTDHNVHDPGITLIELFAWLAEMDLYQLNRIPDRHKQKFLLLIGIRPQPPQPCRAVLSFSLKGGVPLLSLPATVEFAGKDAAGQMTTFRTLAPITVAPIRLQAIQVKDAKGFHNVTERLHRGESVDLFGAIPQPEAALYLGFNQALPVNVPVSLYFTFAGPRSGEDERRRLIQEIFAAKSIFTQVSSDDQLAAPELEKVPPHHSAQTVWEYLTSAEPEEWHQLNPQNGAVEDDTRALTLDGRVTVKFPDVVMVKKSLGESAEELFYLRCRFASGEYDAPPLLRNIAMNGVIAEQAASIGVVKWTIAEGVVATGTAPAAGDVAQFDLKLDAQGRITALNFEVPDQEPPKFLVLSYEPAEPTKAGLLWIEAIALGVGSGKPRQEFTLPEAPVKESSLQLFTLEQNQWRIWQLRPDFDASTRSDAHFVLEPTSGKITFGDGEKGRVPPKGALILAAYHVTRAEAGNLTAGAINQLVDSPHNRAVVKNFDEVKAQFAAIVNPLAASGGSAAETLTHAISRAMEMLETPQRAVTLQDYERLAMETPGTQIARASARANFDPDISFEKNSSRTITLMILPRMPGPKPRPSDGLRQAVAAYFYRRRVIGTRVKVIGPDYFMVAVRASAKAHPGVNKADLRQKIGEALNAFFDPFTGGPYRTGWPFGRDVYRSEVLQVIDEVPGVDHVISLELIPAAGQPEKGNVVMAPTALVEAGQHQIEVVLEKQ